MSRYDAPDTTESDAAAEVVAAIADAVTTCLAERATLDRTLAGLREASLTGEPVQPALTTMFDRCPELAHLAAADRADALADALDLAVEQDQLPPDARTEFRTWWLQHRWIVPGITAYRSQAGDGPTPAWTGRSLSVAAGTDRPMAKHVFRFGVDEVHRIRAPAGKLYFDSVQRAAYILDRLVEFVEESDPLDDETLHYLDASEETVADVVDALETLLSTVDNLPDPPADHPVAEPSGSTLSEMLAAAADKDATSNVALDDDTLAGFH